MACGAVEVVRRAPLAATWDEMFIGAAAPDPPERRGEDVPPAGGDGDAPPAGGDVIGASGSGAMALGGGVPACTALGPMGKVEQSSSLKKIQGGGIQGSSRNVGERKR